MATIASITYKPEGHDAESREFERVPIEQARLVAGHGIEGDQKGGTPGRHLNILSLESVRDMGRNAYNSNPGAFGEQMVVDGIDLDGAMPGTRLRLGSTAIVQLMEKRNGCSRLEKSQGMPKEGTSGKLGMMAEVVESGEVRVGDDVEVISNH